MGVRPMPAGRTAAFRWTTNIFWSCRRCCRWARRLKFSVESYKEACYKPDCQSRGLLIAVLNLSFNSERVRGQQEEVSTALKLRATASGFFRRRIQKERV